MEPDEATKELARRVTAMEAFLASQGYRPPHIAPRAVALPPEAELLGDASRPGEAPPVAAVATFEARPPAPRPTIAVPPPLPRAVPAIARAIPTPPREPAERASPAPVPYAARATVATPPPRSGTMEQAIGLKLAGWIGAIIVVIGAAMGVKFAYDQGWLGGFPDEAKLALLYAAGLAILCVGEWVYRRVGPRAAVGIYAAGVASLFVVGYAGSTYFHLYQLGTAFALMAAACAIGAGIALRGGLLSIAVLSHIGANVAPLILRDRAVGEVPLLAYLLALQLMAVGLANVGGSGRWWILRSLALVTTSLWMTMRLLDPATAHTLPTIVFAGIYAAVFQLELVLAARREDGRSAEAAAWLPSEFSFATFSLAATGALVAEILRWSSDFESATRRGGILIALAMLAATAGTGAFAAKGAALRSLATSWLTQAALLLVIAVPVMLEGPSITIAWAALALAYAVLGVALRRPRTLLAGAAVWAVAVTHLLATTVTQQRGPLHAPAFTVVGIDVPGYLAIALLIGVAGHAIAVLGFSQRLREADAAPEVPARGLATGSARSAADAIAVGATLVWIVALVAALPSLAATVGIIGVAWVVLALGLATSRSLYLGGSLAVMVLALVKWAAVDVLGERFDAGVERSIVFNVPMAVGFAAAVSMLAMLWIARRRLAIGGERTGSLAWIGLVMAVLAMTVGLSVEVMRAADAAAAAGRLAWPVMQATAFGWTLLWLAAVEVMFLLGRTVDPSPHRTTLAARAAGAATLLIAAKFLLVDCVGFAVSGGRVPATVAVNLQTITAGILLIALVWRGLQSPVPSVFRAMMFAVSLVVISIELDRQLGPERTLIAWSAFWGAYAIASIVLGFAMRSASFRFAGLGLLGVTLLKIVVVDLASASTGWRILSFLAVGIVLLITSVLYGKLSPRLLAASLPSPGTPAEG